MLPAEVFAWTMGSPPCLGLEIRGLFQWAATFDSPRSSVRATRQAGGCAARRVRALSSRRLRDGSLRVSTPEEISGQPVTTTL